MESVKVCSISIDYLMMLPERLWSLETGTTLSAGSDGEIKVAENGDWVIGYAVNEGLSHYMKTLVNYKKNERVEFVGECDFEDEYKVM